MEFIQKIIQNAKTHRKHIVLPEALEERTLKAADQVLSGNIARLTLIGPPDRILDRACTLRLPHIPHASILDPQNNPRKGQYIDLMLQLREAKGLTRADAEKLIENPLHLAAIMIKAGHADGEVAGAVSATGDVLRPAFHYIKTLPGTTLVSGAFFMTLPDTTFGHNGLLLFADCAVHPDPTDRQLAEIALSSASTALAIGGFQPRIAMLSFSTHGSAQHETVSKVQRATQIVRDLAPHLIIDGELQADAAIIPSIAKSKAPSSTTAGNANILIFPDLNSGNIAYKLVQRMSGAQALGPILQGMAAPINDLSRGCSVDDIVNLIAVTVNQAAHNAQHIPSAPLP